MGAGLDSEPGQKLYKAGLWLSLHTLMSYITKKVLGEIALGNFLNFSRRAHYISARTDTKQCMHPLVTNAITS